MIIFTKDDKRSKEEREALFNFFRPRTPMSIWDNPATQPINDNSNSKFLNKALGDGDSIVVTFTDLMHKEQGENTPDWAKTKDGKEWVFYFEDEKGNEREFAQSNPNKAFFRDARSAKIEKGQKYRITRKGEGVETSYEFTAPDAPVTPAETKKDMLF